MKLKYLFYVQSLINYLLKKGIPSSEVHRILGIPADSVDPMEHEPAIEQIHELTLFVKKETGIAHCGLEMIRQLNFQNTGFFGTYALSCRTMNEAFHRTYSVQKTINTLFEYSMFPPEKPFRFTYKLDPVWEVAYPESAREIVEFNMANGIYFTRKLTMKDIRAVKIDFKYPIPEHIHLFEDFFRCPLAFDQESNQAIYQKDVMDLQIPTYNPVMLEILQDYARKMIQEAEGSRNIVSQVKGLILRSAHTVIPHIDDIAYQLNMSKRSLQVRLKEKGTSFTEILEGVQKELAHAYLGSSKIPIKEIAWIMGYTDTGNFFRAFKRWTGKSPGEYRKENN